MGLYLPRCNKDENRSDFGCESQLDRHNIKPLSVAASSHIAIIHWNSYYAITTMRNCKLGFRVGENEEMLRDQWKLGMEVTLNGSENNREYGRMK